MKKRHVLAVVGVIALATLTGCGEQQQIRDLENVTVTEPDKTRLVVNVDEYPNAVAICIEGAGFITTTRDPRHRPLQPVPAWDAPNGWCAS